MASNLTLSDQLKDSRALFDRLLRAEAEDDVERILEVAGYGLGNEAVWQNLGGTESNFTTVGNQQADATAALIEKIINGIDAVLMAECLARGIHPESKDAPTSMSEAVQKFFGIHGGRLENLGPTDQGALADRIHLVAVGEKGSPSYLVIDRGEGQTPDSFPETFLSIARSNKMRIHFVQGKFNAGGTGVLQFCGSRNIQLIVSRRHPKASCKSGDKSRDLWGYTIVRRVRPSGGRRSSVYVYLAPNGEVPRFAADSIPVLPEKRTSVHPRAYAVGLPYGSCIKLYNYQWKAKSIATTDARYELERYLQAPCLPFRVTETREYKANYFATTVAGVWATVSPGPGGEAKEKVEDGFPAFGTLKLPRIGTLPYRMVVFKEDQDPRHIPHGVFFTVNGQVHGDLPADFVARTLKFDYLKDHLLVAVDCTAMDDAVREDFFLASRDRVRKNAVYGEIVDTIKEELKDHSGLRALNAARRKKELEQTLSDERETSSVFNDLLKSDPTLANLFNLGDRLVTSTGPGPAVPYEGKRFPTFFRLAKNPKEGLTRECPVNRTVRIEFETDAANDYFDRVDCPGSIATEPENIIQSSNLWNGRFNARLAVPWDAKPGDVIRVKVVVSDVEADKRGKPFESQFTLIAAQEEEPAPPGGKTKNPRAPKPGKKSAPTLALPNILEVKREGWHRQKPPFDEYSAMEIRHDDKGGFDFYLNIHNAFLLTELIRSKDEERPLVMFWFKYGLTLCALGILQEEKRRQGKKAEAESQEPESAEDLERVSRHCAGLARVIVPIIRALPKAPTIGE